MDIISKILCYKIEMASLICSLKWGLNKIQIANDSQWVWVYSDFTHNRFANFRNMSFLRGGWFTDAYADMCDAWHSE